MNGPIEEKVVLKQLALLRQARGDTYESGVDERALEPLYFDPHNIGRLVAWAAELDFKTFFFEHTVQALFDGRPEFDWLISQRRLGPPGAVLCPSCVEVEWEKFGVPTWYRDHQLPGMYQCAEHDTVLQLVQNENAFRQSPSSFVSEAMPVVEPFEMTRDQAVNVQRYLMMCRHFFKRGFIHPLHDGLKALWKRLDLRSPWFHRTVLLKSFPEVWLDTCFGPALTMRTEPHGWDNTVRDRTIYDLSDCERMLLIAALSESDADAIRLMDMGSPGERSEELEVAGSRSLEVHPQLPPERRVADHEILEIGHLLEILFPVGRDGGR